MKIKVKSEELVTDIIIPTYNNKDYLPSCVKSLLAYTKPGFRIHLINNGVPGSLDAYRDFGSVQVYEVNGNLGWVGGINYLKDRVEGPFVLFLNDDTQFVPYDFGWLQRLQLPFFLYKDVGAVGPISNNVAGTQYMVNILGRRHTVGWLSGFCLLTKKEVLDKVGWLDESLPGGDDVDFSIRLKNAGLTILCERDVMVLHKAEVTGKKLYGSYWNSQDYYDALNIALIRKHGLTDVFVTATCNNKTYVAYPPSVPNMPVDEEQDCLEEIGGNNQ